MTIKEALLQEIESMSDELITITSNFVHSLKNNQNLEKDFQADWHRWFDEVDQIEAFSNTSESDEYGNLLKEKYRKQGLQL